ncbi:LegC family aminotransferase [uncultured Brevundimonas sp.]|uniref:LegC family aminotransferase n=1 Tax=uncultured Brevundimonas sp. TaxID=213418 RepID=UPI00261FBC09|nr:LegC family aminotransferase [uncultured Brevundimonas sp.]HRJ63008.1 LegC family aminotransferase [Brevundimonas sp.]
MTQSRAAAVQSSVLADRILAAVRDVLGPTNGVMPLHEPEFRGREREYLKDCIDTGWVSSVGAYVDRIETDLARITGVERAVAVANGTAALHICLELVGVKPGDEVLIPDLTFVATANAVSYAGARPHFVDSEDVSLGVDAARLEAHLAGVAGIRDGVCYNRTTGAPIRALVVMHAFGHPCDLDAIEAVALRWNLALVEDAAESLGSFYKGVHTGGRGRVAALSFNGNKVVTTGGGGAILTNDPELGRRAKHLTTTARVPHRWNFIHDEIGYNYRMPNLNAALGCAQLERLDDMLARKRDLASRYAAAFEGVEGARFLAEPTGTRSNFWLNAIVLEDPDLVGRDRVLERLNDAGYMSRPIWTLMHRLPMYADCPRADLTVAERLEATVINLPSSPKLADA